MSTPVKISPMDTGSDMALTVSRGSGPVKSPPAPWLGRLAKRWKQEPSYTRQMVYSDEFGHFAKVVEAVEEMQIDGHHHLVTLRCAKLDAARAAYQFTETNTAEHCIRLHKNFECDALENPATAAHAMDLGAVSWHTARRRLIAEVQAKLELIRSGDLLFAEGQ